jgi:hypothetical protein
MSQPSDLPLPIDGFHDNWVLDAEETRVVIDALLRPAKATPALVALMANRKKLTT